MKSFKISAFAVKKIFKGEKLDKEDKKALFSTSLYVAGAALSVVSAGGAIVATKALGASFLKHVAARAIHDIIDQSLTHTELLETVKSVGDFLHHFASEEEENKILQKNMINYMIASISKTLEKGISEEDMVKILKEEEPVL